MRDIKTLQPADVPALSGRELDAAVEWWVCGDDLTANTDERRSNPVSHFILKHPGKFEIGWFERRHRPGEGLVETFWRCRSECGMRAGCWRNIRGA